MGTEDALKPRVSVCIANYNGSGVVDRCLASVLAQQRPPAFEILVYDDASDDGSVDEIARTYPQVRLLKGTRNLGYCHANNAMARAATGEFLLLLNNDAWLSDNALEALAAASDEHPDSIFSLRQLDAATGELRDMGMGLDILTVPFPLVEAQSPQLVTVIGACLWVSRERFGAAGGFPEWFGSIAEDLYLCQFARLAGASIHVLDTAHYVHHSGYSFGGGALAGAGAETTYRRRFLSERNRMAVFLSVYPVTLIALLLPVWLLQWTAEALLLSLASRSLAPCSRIYLPAARETLRNMGKIRALRRRTQAARRVSFRTFLRPMRWRPVKLQALLTHGIPKLR